MITQDKDLLEKLIKKDEKALFKFYRKFNLAIFNFLYRQLNDKHLAEEVTQDVFLDFIESLRDFRGQCSLKTFLFTIARNKVIDIIRKKKIKKILFSALSPYVVEGLKTIFLDEEIEKKELAAKIKKVFKKLPNDYQLVLRLKYVEGEKVKSIAHKLSLGFKATESLIFRARKAFIKVFQSLP
ncbi:MAG: RNA polymerase sigma factor [Microgenomates group bacterium]